VWATDATYRILGAAVRVRATSKAFGACAQALLGQHQANLTAGAPAHATCSAVLGESRGGPARPVHTLYGTDCGAVRSTEPGELLAALSEQASLAAWRSQQAADALVLRGGAASWHGGAALLLPLGFARPYALWQHLLDLGFGYLSDAAIAIDLAQAHARPLPKGAVYAPDADWPVWQPPLARGHHVSLRARWHERRLADTDVAAPALVRWAVWLDEPGAAGPHVEPLERSAALGRLCHQASNLRQLGGRGFQTLVRAVAGASCCTLRARMAADAAEALRAYCAGAQAPP
jgi:hypothetical protein